VFAAPNVSKPGSAPGFFYYESKSCTVSLAKGKSVDSATQLAWPSEAGASAPITYA